MKTDTLRKAIAREEAMLADLSHKHNESQKRLTVLKSELAAMESIPAFPSASLFDTVYWTASSASHMQSFLI